MSLSKFNTPRKRKHLTSVAQLDPAVRDFAASLLAASGSDEDALMRIFERAGYEVTDTTARRWKARKLNGESPVKARDKVGRPPTFSDEAKQLVAGFIFSHINSKKNVNFSDVRNFAEQKLGIKAALSTVSDVVTSLGFRLKKVARKNKTLAVDPHEWPSTWVSSRMLHARCSTTSLARLAR